jgi:hypothetical protein
VSRFNTGCDRLVAAIRAPSFEDGIKQLRRTCFALFDGRISAQRGVASQPDIARQTRAGRLRQLTQYQRFLLPRLGRAARSKARREQIIGDAEPPPGSRGEPGSTTSSVPLPPAHSPWRGIHAKCDHDFSPFACRTHASVTLDVVFSGIDDVALWNVGRTFPSAEISARGYSA